MTEYGPHIDSFRHYSHLIAGQRTATVTLKGCRVPWDGRVANAYATARTNGASTPTLTVDLKVGATSKLAAAISVTSGDYTAGSPATDPSVNAGDELDIVLTIGGGGGSPTWDDIVVEWDLVRT